jgi:hypothetical protein
MRVIAVHGAAVNGATWMPLERALIGHDALAEVRAIRVPIVWNAARFSRAALAGQVIVEPNAPHGVGILRPAAFAGAIASMHA